VTGWIHTRIAVRIDYPELVEIERASDFCHAWEEKDIQWANRQRDHVLIVAEVDGRTVGYLFYRIHLDRYEVKRLIVHPAYRRRGVGGWLLAHVWQKIRPDGKRDRVIIDVPETNMTACLFLRSQGFLALQVLRDEYGGEDEYRFVLWPLEQARARIRIAE
jgi:[ribosomal protein S18]-alanine N-acetyltransferase